MGDDLEHVLQPDRYLKVWPTDHPENRYFNWYASRLLEACQRSQRGSDDDVLRWILEFTRQDIAALSDKEKLDLNFDLAAVTLRQLLRVSPHDGPIPLPDLILTDLQFFEIQTYVAEGLQALMTEELDGEGFLLPSSATWALPPCPRRVVRDSAMGSVETKISSHYLPADPIAMIVNTIADVIVRSGQRLRACANCLTLFVANKRQAYCSPSCSQAKRTQRKRDRMRPVPTDELQWYTRQK